MYSAPSSSRRPLIFGAFVAAVLLVGAAAVHVHRRSGLAVPEWPLAVDLLLLVPLAYLLVFRPPARQAVAGVAALLALGILFGALVLPEQSKSLWLVLESSRWVVVAVFVAFQAGLMALVVKDLLVSRAAGNLEHALHAALDRHFGASVATGLMKIEARMWLYALCWNRSRLQFARGERFFVWKQGENASNQLGFLVVMAAEVPVLHLLLHLYSPVIALVVTAFSLYGLLFLMAEYRATRYRPITIDGATVHLRYGLLVDTALPVDAIASIVPVGPVDARPRRAAGRWRLAGMGKPNVLLRLAPGTRLRTPFGERQVGEIFLGVDDPARFIRSVRR